mmetsp:Transcript_7096/g.5059  ORF Transcript_7096/g.5059 Transcript_7096/m.5059 type:complete len:85 (+) Transcript_7096:408-662(+)
MSKKVMVTYKDGVYDLSDFAKSHPGGADKLLMAVGGDIQPFWEMYPFHKVESIFELLKKYRVGDLHAEDILDEKNLPDFSEIQH